MAVRAGRLRSRVAIMRQTQVATGKGGFTASWNADPKPIAAEVIAISGREDTIDHVLQGISVYRITVRWRANLSPREQLRLANGQVLNIKSADDPDGRRRDLVIIADTVATTGA